MRVSELIKTEDIKQWANDEIILIDSPTGSGKSTFILNSLYNYAVADNKKILMLTNRDLLKEQTLEQINNQFKNKNIINVLNYQAIENFILHKMSMDFLNQYNYIVCDEAHYFFTDSNFNNITDLSLKWILNQEDKIRIFMSATPKLIHGYLTKYKKIKIKEYKIKKDYKHIQNIYFYNNSKIIKNMLFNLPKDEKAIYFTNAKIAYNTKRDLPDSGFICSKHNNKYNKYINDDIRNQVIKNQKFDCQTLCTTTTLDNGINIIDNSVKHIIIDVFDLDILEQCLGRRRLVDENDKINLYIKDYTNKTLAGKKLGIGNIINMAIILRREGVENLIKKYPRKNYGKIIYDVVDSSGQTTKMINEIMYFKYLFDSYYCSIMLEDEDKMGYKKYVCDRLQFPVGDIKDMENIHDTITLENKLDKLVGTKLFNKDKDKFMDFIRNDLFNGVQSRYGKIQIDTINGFFKDNNYPYVIESKKERSRKSTNYNKWYWVISKKVYNIH